MSQGTPSKTAQQAHNDVERLLKSVPRDGNAGASLEVQQALALARELCNRARELQTPQERRQQAELDRMMQSVRASAIDGARTIVGKIIEDVRDFTGSVPQNDDITLIAIRKT